MSTPDDLISFSALRFRTQREHRRIHLSVDEAGRAASRVFARIQWTWYFRASVGVPIKDTRHFELEFPGLCSRFAAPLPRPRVRACVRLRACHLCVTFSVKLHVLLECSRLRRSGDITTSEKINRQLSNESRRQRFTPRKINLGNCQDCKRRLKTSRVV